jgi:hypothetical protein
MLTDIDGPSLRISSGETSLSHEPLKNDQFPHFCSSSFVFRNTDSLEVRLLLANIKKCAFLAVANIAFFHGKEILWSWSAVYGRLYTESMEYGNQIIVDELSTEGVF